MRSRLADLVGMLVGVTVLCTLGSDCCAIIERVILLLLSVLGAGPFGGTCILRTRAMLVVCTLGTHCMLGLVEDVAVSAKRSGWACICAFVVSMIRWRSWTA